MTKKLIAAMATTAALLTPFSVLAAESASYWPSWIGRVRYSLIPNASPARQMTLGPDYLPRSLVRTGALEQMLRQIRTQGGVSADGLPVWLEDLIEDAE